MTPNPPDDAAGTTRLHDVTDRIARFRRALDAACAAAGRRPEDIALIAVTKNHPAATAAHAVRCGLTQLGENKAQELTAKRAAVAELLTDDVDEPACHPPVVHSPVWHFVGRLQRNKAKQVVAAADVIHSVDRLALAESIIKAAQASERWEQQRLRVLIQIDLDPARRPGDRDSDASRGGVHPDDVARLADALAGCDRLALAGVMAVAPLDADPDDSFARLAGVSARLRRDHPDAVEISAGMTHDYASAIAHGSTMVRIGTALFGPRPMP